VSFPRGTGEIVQALEARLESTRIMRGVPAAAVAANARGLVVELGEGDRREAEAVIVATPAPDAARLVRELDPELGGLLGRIDFASSAVVHLGYRESAISHPLDGYGYIIPRGEAGPLVACTWSSRKWEGRAPAGTILLRLYAGSREEEAGTSDAELVAMARGELAATLGISAEPVLTRLHRWEQAMPRYSLGHPRRVAAIEERALRHPGLFLAGASYRGVGIPDCIESGRAAARGALAHMRRQGARP
jgi:oxygen-dependent protoporphyrinogen oxidase